MSTALYLYCTSTRQVVHVAEISGSNGVRGPDHPGALALFCCAHEGAELQCGSSDEIDFWTEEVEPFDHEHYLLWTAANAAAAHEKLQSHPRRTRL
ncbi:MAG: hypothetical protein VB135_00365 [Burkholderia sp.]